MDLCSSNLYCSRVNCNFKGNKSIPVCLVLSQFPQASSTSRSKWDYRDFNNTEITGSCSTSTPENAPLLLLWVPVGCLTWGTERFTPPGTANGPQSPMDLCLLTSPPSSFSKLRTELSSQCKSYHMIPLLNTHLWSVLLVAVPQSFPILFFLIGSTGFLWEMPKIPNIHLPAVPCSYGLGICPGRLDLKWRLLRISGK